MYARLVNVKSGSKMRSAKEQEAALSGQPAANEKYSLDTQCLSKRNILIDILPCVYSIVHPEVREVNIQLYNEWERTVFVSALEFMVVFNIKIKISDRQAAGDFSSFETHVPQFEPDLASLVVFGSSQAKHLTHDYNRGRYSGSLGHASQSKGRPKGKRLPMRHKAQRLLMQNYERIKQAMLIGLDTRRVIFLQRGAPQPPAGAKGAADGTAVKQGLRGFMTELQSRPLTNTKKKRTLDEITSLQAASGKLEAGQGGKEVSGRFRFKFQEGHSKNFRREVAFDWFLNKK